MTVVYKNGKKLISDNGVNTNTKFLTQKEKKKEYDIAHREKKKEYDKVYRQEHREKIKERKKEYYEQKNMKF